MRLNLLLATLLISLLAGFQSGSGDLAAPVRGGGDEDGEAEAGASLELICSADPTEVVRGDLVTWNATLCNPGPKAMQNVFLKADFDSAVEPVAFSASPSEALVWSLGEMGAESCAGLSLVVRVPRPERRFTMSRSVSGEGFVSLSEDYSTAEEAYEIGCDFSAWAEGMGRPIRSSTVVAVLEEAGAEVIVREMGSGDYSSREEVRVDSRNNSVEVFRNLSAASGPFNLSLGDRRSANYTSPWFEMIAFRNEFALNFTNQSRRNATFLDCWCYAKLDQMGTVLISGGG